MIHVNRIIFQRFVQITPNYTNYIPIVRSSKLAIYSMQKYCMVKFKGTLYNNANVN